MDIVDPLPADHRHDFLIVFGDCYSRYTILVPASNHTANTVSDALLRHVVPYFGTPRRLLFDRGREFVGEVWGKVMRSLGVQRVLTSPYLPEGNAVNERSHRTRLACLKAHPPGHGWRRSQALCWPSTRWCTSRMVSRHQWSLLGESLPFPQTFKTMPVLLPPSTIPRITSRCSGNVSP